MPMSPMFTKLPLDAWSSWYTIYVYVRTYVRTYVQPWRISYRAHDTYLQPTAVQTNTGKEKRTPNKLRTGHHPSASRTRTNLLGNNVRYFLERHTHTYVRTDCCTRYDMIYGIMVLYPGMMEISMKTKRPCCSLCLVSVVTAFTGTTWDRELETTQDWHVIIVWPSY